MSYTQAQLEAQVQELLQDTGTGSNCRMIEDLTVQVVGGNGTRTVFTLSKPNIVANSVKADQNQTGFSSSNIASVDTVNGLVTFTTAPSLSGTVPTNLTVLYYFQQFTLTEIDEFINIGLGYLNQTAPMTGANSTTDYQNLASGQIDVVCLYAATEGYYALANKYARIVDMSAEGKSSAKAAISKQYLALAKEFYDRAEKERLALNGPRQGRSTVASAKLTNGRLGRVSSAVAFNYGGQR